MGIRWSDVRLGLDAELVEIGAGFALPSRFTASVEEPDGPGVVTVTVALVQGQYAVERLEVEATQEPITGETLRRLALGDLIARLGREQLRLTTGQRVRTLEPPEDLAAQGPTATSLAYAAALYRFHHAIGQKPTQSVADVLGIARPTAAKWLRLAREQGLLGPTTKWHARSASEVEQVTAMYMERVRQLDRLEALLAVAQRKADTASGDEQHAASRDAEELRTRRDEAEALVQDARDRLAGLQAAAATDTAEREGQGSDDG